MLLASLPLDQQRSRIAYGGILYAVSVKEDGQGLIRFGFTGKDVDSCVRQLCCDSPVELVALGACDAKRSHLRAVLTYCRTEREKGEWHRRGVRTTAAVECIRGGDAREIEKLRAR